MYDIVIVSHEKDFNKIKYVVENAEKNLSDFKTIHLIITDNELKELDIIRKKTTRPVIVHLEQDVLKIDKSKIVIRPHWIYQILLKMFQNVTEEDNFLILESDGIINKKLSFFEDDKTILYLGLNHSVTQSYFTFNNMINIKNKYPHSLISEVMMYDKKYVKEMLKNCSCDSTHDFIEKYIFKNLSTSCCPADYEIYGNFLYNFYPDKIIFKKFNYSLNGRYSRIEDWEIENIIKNNIGSDYISFHSWIENL
jgi:hypothetical protein